jgi:hypothetical protein
MWAAMDLATSSAKCLVDAVDAVNKPLALSAAKIFHPR